VLEDPIPGDRTALFEDRGGGTAGNKEEYPNVHVQAA
jgi:hypothetical protein